jgi:release factor glutamine methyltransferase
MTVMEVIQRSSEFLGRKGVESPRLQVELLLAHVLRMPRLQLYLNFERPLLEPELDTVRALVKRRGQREPLQHLLGTTSFCGLEIKVNGAVLIPRPETEQLAERAWTFLLGSALPSPRVLDFGTGSGCLAIALAVRCPQASLHAVEISEAALEVARANAAAHQVADRIQFHAGNAFQALPAGLRFDLIVANPPYIPTAEIDRLQPEVKAHDPRLALDGGEDGLEFFRLLAAGAHPFLAESGKMMWEFGDGQAHSLRELLENQKWIVEAVEADYSGRPRLLTARWVG